MGCRLPLAVEDQLSEAQLFGPAGRRRRPRGPPSRWHRDRPPARIEANGFRPGRLWQQGFRPLDSGLLRAGVEGHVDRVIAVNREEVRGPPLTEGR